MHFQNPAGVVETITTKINVKNSPHTLFFLTKLNFLRTINNKISILQTLHGNLVVLCGIQTGLQSHNELQGLWNITEKAMSRIRSFQLNSLKLQRE